MHLRSASWRAIALTVATASLLATTSPSLVLAAGSAENAVLIIDPTDPHALHIGNYYKNARNIPDSNVLYVRSAAASYETFVNTNQAAFRGEIAKRGIDDHTDYVILAPLNQVKVPVTPGLVANSCNNILLDHLSLTAAYSIAPISNQVLSGAMSTIDPNGYGLATAPSNAPLAFHAQTRYRFGEPSTDSTANSYFLGALLGYAGPSGNTITELRAMIDRSVESDGSHPAGTVYFMNAVDATRNSRACSVSGSACAQSTPPIVYNNAAGSILALGASAAVLNGNLPPANTPGVMGVMSGFSSANISAAGLGLMPGSFADHLTSFAGWVDCTGGSCQTRVSDWIRAGASGSAGSVSEVCNHPWKYPSPDFHRYYSQGMSLGESYLRSVHAIPFSMLLYGDPLTRPFASIPNVTVDNPPTGTASGTITIAPSATASHPGATIVGYDLLVDGVKLASAGVGQSFTLDTADLNDGRHDLRVLARDDSNIENMGRWIGTLDTDNHGHSATLSVTPSTGNLAQLFSFAYAASSAGLKEVRLVQNGRVLTASTSANGTFTVYGQNLGGGPSTVKLEAWYTDNRFAWSAPVSVDITPSGTPTNAVPIASSYTKIVTTANPQLVELPARFDASPGNVGYGLRNSLTMSSLVQANSLLPYIVIKPQRGLVGSEQIRFEANIAGVTSNVGTVTVAYTPVVTIISPPAGASSATGTAVAPRHQGGQARIGPEWRARLWSGKSSSWVDLHPAGATSSYVTSISGTQQAGNVVFGTSSHAALWSGSAASWVDLTPAGAIRSTVQSLRGGIQAGTATISGVDRASIWNGTASSRLDLHPTAGALASYAFGTSGTFVGGHSQVGYVVTPAGHSHAALWQNGGSWVDLNPAGSSDSYAYDVHDGSADGVTGQQVGIALVGTSSRASVWTGTSASWVDINPAGATSSAAYGVLYLSDTDRFYQVGSATIASVSRASLWTGTANSWVDLSAYLPPAYAGYSSSARAISSDEHGIYIVGSAERAGGTDLVMWRLP